MGSLYSKPELPRPTYVAPTYTPPAVTPTVPTAAPETEDGDVQKIASAVRRRTLPQTILTSFRGVLGQGEWVPQRKSLLGE